MIRYISRSAPGRTRRLRRWLSYHDCACQRCNNAQLGGQVFDFCAIDFSLGHPFFPLCRLLLLGRVKSRSIVTRVHPNLQHLPKCILRRLRGLDRLVIRRFVVIGVGREEGIYALVHSNHFGCRLELTEALTSGPSRVAYLRQNLRYELQGRLANCEHFPSLPELHFF